MLILVTLLLTGVELAALIFVGFRLKSLSSNYGASKPGALDFQFNGYSPETAKGMVEAYQQEGRDWYDRASIHFADVLFPVTYAFLSIIIVLQATDTILSGNRWLCLLAIPGLATMLFDYAENFFIHKLLVNFPNSYTQAQWDKWANTASLFTKLKWGFGFPTLGIGLALLVEILLI